MQLVFFFQELGESATGCACDCLNVLCGTEVSVKEIERKLLLQSFYNLEFKE